MKKIKLKKLYSGLICFAAAFAMILSSGAVNSMNAYAETVTTTLAEMKQEGELIAVFTFDKEKPSITLVSPSGDKYTESSSGIEFAEGDNWCTFKITDAETGIWTVEYDRGENTEFDFSVTNGTEAIAIQNFTVNNISGTEAEVSFLSEMGSITEEYNYIISAVIGEDSGARELASGKAVLGEQTDLKVDLSKLSSYSGYKLLLEVYYEGATEVSDAVYSDSFSYANPNEGESVSDFKLYVDSAQGSVRVDWGEFADYRADGYAVICYADDNKDEPVYTSDLMTETACEFSYPFDTMKIEVELYKSTDSVLSKAISKTIDFENGEYLKINTEDVTNSAQAEIAYNAANDAILRVVVNEEEAIEYNISGQSTAGISLSQGTNSFYCEFEGENGIIYTASKEIYVSNITPEIILYENLSGKSFDKGTITVSGKAVNASKVTVNGNEITLSDNGEFSFEAEIKEKINNYLVEAESVTGNITNQNVELKLKSANGSILSNSSYLPLIVSLCASAVIIILGFVFLKNNPNSKVKGASKSINPRTNRIILVVADVLAIVTEVICVIKFIALYKIVNGIEFIRIAENSTAKALKYLNAETRGGIIIIALGVLIILLEIFTFAAFRKKILRKQKNKE